MRKTAFVILVIALAAAGIAAFRGDWANARNRAVALIDAFRGQAANRSTSTGTPGTSGAAVPAVAGAAATGPPHQSDVTEASPAVESETNLALTDSGGHVERITGEYGPGYFGRRLIDDRTKPSWAPAPITFPREVLFSFYGRQPALVTSVVIVLADNPSAAPKDIEVWASMESPGGKFVKLAAQILEPKPGAQKVAFPAVEVRWVKLVLISGYRGDALEMAEIRIMEARRAGYTPLFERQPDVAFWKRSPRDGAQLGLEWLQPAAVGWQKKNKCFGCHVQAQVLMGQAIARRNEYIVSEEAFRELADFTREQQNEDGRYHNSLSSANEGSITQFASMGLAYFDDVEDIKEDPKFLKSVNWLLANQQSDGRIPDDLYRPPIVQGELMRTANTVVAFVRAHKVTGDNRYKEAADRGLAWIAATPPETTQDKIFKVVALSRFGTADQKRVARQVVQQLRSEQQADGGWRETERMEGANAFATGQVLYAFKQMGVSVSSPMFKRGVRYLLDTQIHDTDTEHDGAWRAVNTQSGEKSEFAPTMWAVIGLAGAFGTVTTGSLQVISDLERGKPSSTNLEIILDASGSMKLPLGQSTRWQTALNVLDRIVTKLPDHFNVGLRAYAHRYSARSKETCTDTELVVPIGRLDRARLSATVNRLKPRGETPLIYSMLQAPADLKPAGGGSVIVITDGEDTCKGDPVAAAQQLKGSGLDLTLNIVGFTLQGRQVQQQLSALAESTGGRYYSAQSGDELARALLLAAIDRFPYVVFDASGQRVAEGEAGPLAEDLPPGEYRVVVQVAGEELVTRVIVSVGKDAVLKVVLTGDRFVIQRQDEGHESR